MEKITATIKAKSGMYAAYQRDGKIAQNRKEANGLINEYAVLVAGDDYGVPRNGLAMRSVVTARIYCSKYGATFYACVWINAATDHKRKAQPHSVSLSGGGKAGGYGYHKASAALDCALSDAGIVLSESIGGRGETAMLDALGAVARAIGYKKFYIHNAHA